MSEPAPPRRTTAFFFGGVALLFLSLSPFAIHNMGYAGEEMATCRQLLGRFAPASTESGIATVEWPRNGAVGLLFQCPFLAVSHALAGPSVDWEDRLLALQPVLATALLVTLLFVWCSRLAGSARWGYALALVAGFGTMLWPYAYIGLETTQSLFLLLAGYLALRPDSRRTWPNALLFAACAAVAVGSRSSGMMLVPAVGYLMWEYFRGAPDADRRSRRLAAQAIVVATFVAAVFVGNTYVRSLSWRRFGGTWSFTKQWLEGDPVSPLLNLLALAGSPNKGLLVFAPIAILALVLLPRAFAENRRVALFAALTLAGQAGGVALLRMWADEIWGPRYLHSSIGPLVLCIAAARGSRRFRVRSEVPLLAAAVLGFAVSFLGSLFYYGSLMGVAAETEPLTMQALQGDPTWNHVRFQYRLTNVWLRVRRGKATEPEFLRPPIQWDFRDPSRRPVIPWKPVDLRLLASPQPLLFRPAGTVLEQRIKLLAGLAALFGLALTLSAGRRAAEGDAARPFQ